MKKFIFFIIISFLFIGNSVLASEIEDDYLDIASNYCVMGDYNSAIEYLDKILTINPQNKRVQDLKKGLNHLKNGDKLTFIQNVNPLIKQAMDYKKNGDEKNEYKTLIQATSEQNAYLAYYYLANYYRDRNQYSKAIDAYNSATSLRSDFAPAYLSSAVVLYEVGKYDSVINSVDMFLSYNPYDDLAYALKSRAEFALGMFENSETDNKRALALNDCPEYQFDRAKLLYMAGKYQEAKKLFESLLKEIQTSKIYEYMGLCDYQMKNYNKALLNFDKAILLSNDDQYLESKYNEIKNLLENEQNAQTNEN